jgi:hypothetical protein
MGAIEKTHYFGKLAGPASMAFLAVGVASCGSGENGNVASGGGADCTDEQGLTYICDLVVPEDVVNLGSTGLVLVSGHRAPGNMYLVTPADGRPLELIHSDMFSQQHDAEMFPDCPGPLNTESFDVHGISPAEIAPRRFSLYTTSHGEREAIEVYELDLTGADPSLTWTGCVLLSQGGYHNAVIRLGDGGFVATYMRDQDVSNADVQPGQITGHLVEWQPGGEPQTLAGTEMSLPNGIDVSADERFLYVAASGTNELVRFDRSQMPMAMVTAPLPIRPDNFHWDTDGNLLSAGAKPADPTCAGPGCATAGWSAIEIDAQTFDVTVLGGADADAAMQRVSAAIRLGDEIWVGSNLDRIARFPVD